MPEPKHPEKRTKPVDGVTRIVENIDETAAMFSEPKITAVGIPAVLNYSR